MIGAAGLLTAALLAAEPPVPKHEALSETRELLEQRRYYFCAEGNDYQPDSYDDLRWCELAARDGFERCPGYREVCEREVDLEFDPDWLGEGEGEDGSEPDESERKANARNGKGRKGKGRVERKPREESEPWSIELPNLGGFARVLMWIVLIAAAAAIIYAIVKNLVRGKAEEDADEAPPPDVADPQADAAKAARLAVETDVQRLLARAEQSAARGDHESAIQDVYAALLRRLEGDSLINLDPWKTNGEYLWELRSKPALRDEVRTIVRDIEQVQFGGAFVGPSGAELATAEASRYHSIRSRVVAVVSRATLALLLAFGLGSQIACDPEPEPDTRALVGLGNGPAGSRAVGELLAANDIDARYRTATLEQLTQTDGAIVLLGGVTLTSEEWDRLIRWVDNDAGVLIIATGLDFPTKLGIAYTPGDLQTELRPAYEYDWYYQNLHLFAPAGRVLTIDSSADIRTDELLVRPGQDSIDANTGNWSFAPARPYAVVQRRLEGDDATNPGKIIVLAEPDLFTNAALTVGDNGALLVNMLRAHDIDEVEFVDAMTGSGADSPLESMRESKLWAVFLQILLLLALLYAAVGTPFARLRDAEQRRRRSFIEHVETLGQRYAQNRAARHVAALYSAWALDRLRERLQPGASQGLLPLAQAIAARTGRSEAEIMQILVQAHELREDKGAVRGSPQDLQLMRELSRLIDATRGSRR